MQTPEWICRKCGTKKDTLVLPKQHRDNYNCERCGAPTLCFKYNEPPQKKRKRKVNYHYIRITKKQKKALEKKAEQIGCSVHSLVVNFIDDGLNPKVVAVPSYSQEITERRTIQHERKVKTSGPVGYQAPSYFQELKEVLAARQARTKK